MQSAAFDPVDARATLAQLPQAPAVYALYGAEAHFEPYIGRTPNLRVRLARLLQPSAKHPRRLQLAGRVRRIEWRLTGSEFEGLLLQFTLLAQLYGEKSLERMHLRNPAFVRFLGGNPYPRIVVTHRPSQREAEWAYGPFASRAAAERFADEVLKLFLLRRCTEDLSPNPSHPGCVYSEMKMCLAPCFQGCTDERYAEEAEAVERFLATRGESRLISLRTERDQASSNLEFESAATLHVLVQRVETVRALAPELVRPLSELRAVILQASANPGEVAVFLFENKRLTGPAGFSTLGMRIQNEQSGSSSLFAQPMAIEPIPETPDSGATGAVGAGLGVAFMSKPDDAAIAEGALRKATADPSTPIAAENAANFAQDDRILKMQSLTGESMAVRGLAPPMKLARGMLDARLEAVLAELADPKAPSPTLRQGHLALLKRWYYRPEARRTGEIFFPDAEGRWPVKAILRGIGRVAAKSLPHASLPQ